MACTIQTYMLIIEKFLIKLHDNGVCSILHIQSRIQSIKLPWRQAAGAYPMGISRSFVCRCQSVICQLSILIVSSASVWDWFFWNMLQLFSGKVFPSCFYRNFEMFIFVFILWNVIKFHSPRFFCYSFRLIRLKDVIVNPWDTLVLFGILTWFFWIFIKFHWNCIYNFWLILLKRVTDILWDCLQILVFFECWDLVFDFSPTFRMFTPWRWLRRKTPTQTQKQRKLKL